MNRLNNNIINGRKRSYEAQALESASNLYHGGMPAPSTPYQWHEMDYASTAMDTTRFAPTSAPIQFNTPSMMSFSPVDYVQHDFPYNTQYPENDTSASTTLTNLYRVGPLRYAELANIDGDAASVSQESMYSRSTRLHSLTDSERRDSQANSILSSNDARRESEGYERIFPLTSLDPDTRQGEVSARERPCLDMSHLSSIEECTSIPHMSSSPHFSLQPQAALPRPSGDHGSPASGTQSTLTSPTTLKFLDSALSDASKGGKSRRMPRSKSASASLGEGGALEKASKLRARQAHSLVERKYRDNLNLKISQLHQTLQNARYGPTASLRSPQKELPTDYFDEDTVVSPDAPNDRSSTGSTPTGSKARKSDVLDGAMNYVNAAEVEMRHMSQEIIRLNAFIKTMQKQLCEECKLLSNMDTLHVEGQQASMAQ